MTVLSAGDLFGSVGVPIRILDTTAVEPTGTVAAESLKVVFTMAGWTEVRSPGDAIAATRGTVLTIPAELECCGLPEALSRSVTFYLHPEYLGEQVRWLAGTHPLVHQMRHALSGDAGLQRLLLPQTAMRTLEPRLTRLARLPRHPEQEFAMLSMASDVFDLVGRFSGVSATRVSDHEPTLGRPRDEVVAAIDLMRQHVSRTWQIDTLAREVALSTSQLRRLFRSQVGVSPSVCLTGLRTGHMAELLTSTSLSVAEAARASGWQNPTVASRAFKKRYGMSPREYAAITR